MRKTEFLKLMYPNAQTHNKSRNIERIVKYVRICDFILVLHRLSLNVVLNAVLKDGFYEGELMNGKRGLVPSNFIEKVPGMLTMHNAHMLHFIVCCICVCHNMPIKKVLIYLLIVITLINTHMQTARLFRYKGSRQHAIILLRA